MKKRFKGLLSLALCQVLIFSMAASADAAKASFRDKCIAIITGKEVAKEETVSDANDLIGSDEIVEKWVNSGWMEGSKPSADDILATGDDIYIKMPHESYYLDCYEYKYVNDRDNKHSVYVFDNPDNGTNAKYPRPRAYHGSRVIVLAERQVHSCVLYWTADNVMHAGWISSANLQDEFPGVVFSVGKMSANAPDKGVDSFIPALMWSDAPADGTRTKYTFVSNEGKKCVSVTLDYHVIGRNDVPNPHGTREVYCLIAGKWIKAGEFELDKSLSPVLYTIHFNSPVILDAFLIVPKDLNKEGIDVRQSVVEMRCVAS